MNEIDLYMDKAKAKGSDISFDLYASVKKELEKQAKNSNKATKITMPITDFSSAIPASELKTEQQNPMSGNRPEAFVSENYKIQIANKEISMSATNWLLLFISFLLFLHLILK